jgi:hypothetical protein
VLAAAEAGGSAALGAACAAQRLCGHLLLWRCLPSGGRSAPLFVPCRGLGVARTRVVVVCSS